MHDDLDERYVAEQFRITCRCWVGTSTVYIQYPQLQGGLTISHVSDCLTTTGNLFFTLIS